MSRMRINLGAVNMPRNENQTYRVVFKEKGQLKKTQAFVYANSRLEAYNWIIKNKAGWEVESIDVYADVPIAAYKLA